MKKRLFLIDGNSFCYRAFYAIKGLATSKGQPTNAVYGFVTMLKKILQKEKPQYLAVAFDLKAPTFRHEKFKDYKIQRRPMPDGLISQMPIIKEVLKAYQIAIFEKEGYEADDLLATIAKKAEEAGFEVCIVSQDKDILQLVNENIKVYSPGDHEMLYDRDKVKARFGIVPEQVVELMSLMGDSSDNIPGIPGIGEKTAVELLKEFGSLKEILAHPEKIKSLARRKLVEDNQKLAILSLELAQVEQDVPLDIAWEALKVKAANQDSLWRIFRELEFKTFLKDLAPEAPTNDARSKIEELSADKIAEWRKNESELNFLVDLETQPLCASFLANGEKKFYSPQAKQTKEIFAEPRIKKVSSDLKTQLVWLKNNGIDLKGLAFDCAIAAYLINPELSAQDLPSLAWEYLQQRLQPLPEKGEVLDEKREEQLLPFLQVIAKLRPLLEKEIIARKQEELFFQVEMPLLEVLAEMELNGVCLDTDFLAEMSKKMDEDLRRMMKNIFEIAGEEFNLNSPKQLSAILFDKLNLPKIKRTKTGASTDVEVLEKLSLQHALPAEILKYREISKLKSTYVDALPKMINPKTQRLHTSFNQTATATGRLSSSNPNLQNIPIKGLLGRQIRKAFIPGEKDCLLLCADYSQIELRILAHISQDESLTRAFHDERDIHIHTASLIFEVEEKKVSPQMRETAKRVNFGIIYGMSAYGLSKDMKIPLEKAEEFITAYFARYPKVKTYMQEQIELAGEKGYVTTLLNRRRYIPEIKSANQMLRQFAERTAINTPIQGSASDLIKLAMLEIQRQLKEAGLKTKMILQVHDELVFEVCKPELEKIKHLVKEKMENVMKLRVPIKVDTKVGKNWLEME
jgi:DNA polymerase-1